MLDTFSKMPYTTILFPQFFGADSQAHKCSAHKSLTKEDHSDFLLLVFHVLYRFFKLQG